MSFRKFEFSAGSLALNLVDTVANRAAAPVELLATPADLADWFEQAGFDSAPVVSAHQLRSAIVLREAIFQAVVPVLAGDLPSDAAIQTINSVAARADMRPQYVDGVVTYRAKNPVAALLSRIAADAVENIGTEIRDRLRRCPECEMVFRDNSRPGQRKWCSSSSGCGNRAKVRRHRAKQKSGGG